MRATVFHAKGDVRVKNVPDPKLRKPTGAVVRSGCEASGGKQEIAAVRVTHTYGPGEHVLRRVSRQEIEDAFAEGWKVESIDPTRYEVQSDSKDISFSDCGLKAWFVVVRRAG